MKLKIQDIIFWIFISIIIGTSLWLLHGSPTEENAIISIGLAVAGSELLIWRYIFSLDKKTCIGFLKVKPDIEDLKTEINNRFDKIDNKLDLIREK